uniref:Uncharacterized protein n=1 Tax=Anguilla anguilla TaxID=7936 RepID=A0A0E9TR05_ANGAN
MTKIYFLAGEKAEDSQNRPQSLSLIDECWFLG